MPLKKLGGGVAEATKKCLTREEKNMVIKRQKLICISISVILTALIMLSFAITLIGGGNEVADGAVIGNADTISTDLLMDKAKRGTSVNSTVFNGNALNELYEKLAGAGADFNTVATKARTPKTSTYSNSSVRSMHAGMDSGEIRSANGGNNIIVKLDGKEWIVTALTTKDTSSSSDVILTLMLKDIAYTSKWGDWSSLPGVKDFSSAYPPSMYSTSYIRAGLLNGGSQYTTNGSNLMNFTATSIYGSGGYPFSIYTDNTEPGNITNFLVKPNEVLYQQYENLYDIAHVVSNNWYNAPNDSSLNAIPDSKWYSKVVDTTYGTHQIQSKTGYYDWGNDLIWLPSLSETGQNSRSGVNASGGLWNLDAGQRGVSAGYCSWLRSGNSYSAYAFYLDAAGTYSGTTVP
ncbi:MAG: hypothetical protein K2O31_05610, partial [Clostridia bacterium]|nr:hypothetical protein [Clostridia bacterium]